MDKENKLNFSDNIVKGPWSNLSKEEALSIAIIVSNQISSLLACFISSGDDSIEEIKNRTIRIKATLDELLKSIEVNPENNICIDNSISDNNVDIELEKRKLETGGLKPPSERNKISSLNINEGEKFNLIYEARKMREMGQTIIKSNWHNKRPTTISEFTEPFLFLENSNDYNGSLLINLLKSEIEINNHAGAFNISLPSEFNRCDAGDCLIISVYDISGSSSNGEEKRFLIILNFDKLSGVVSYSYPIFMSGKNAQFSTRQVSELEKFLKSKKINFKNLQ